MNGRISIRPTFAISSGDTFLIRIEIVALVLDVMAAIIPIPWHVPAPLRVLKLWSTLSADYCAK